MLIELNWHGNSSTYFSYELKSAIDSIYTTCGITIKKNSVDSTEIENKSLNLKDITLTTTTLTEQKKECLNKGGKYSWDLKKDIFKCIN